MFLQTMVAVALAAVPVYGQAAGALPRSGTPEAQGVSSAGVNAFLDAVAQSQIELHSVMVVRHGQVVTEGWWKPYGPDLKHTMYSASKSFTATAVGFAVAEKKLTVKDKIVSIFPDDLPEVVSPNLAALRVRDLLSMSVGHKSDPTWPVGNSSHWVKAFLETPLDYEPGTHFVYNSVATYMLSAIVQKVTGETLIDYLRPRLFEPLGITGADWETSPQGVNTGGWGLRVKTEDMAKFGQLFLQKGRWQGQQILPAVWVEEATSIKIMQEPDAPQAKKESNDWVQGYCYQMWRSRHNSYRGDGANGQFILVLPDQDAVIAITAESPDMQAELNLVWDHLLPAMRPEPLAADEQAAQQLQERLAALALPPARSSSSAREATVSGQTFDFAANERGVKTAGFEFGQGVCHLDLTTETGSYRLDFGAGRWEPGETTRKGPYLVATFRNNREGLPPFKVVGCYAWQNDDTLVLTLRYIESPHTETIRCRFEEERVSVDFEDIYHEPDSKKTCQGTLRKQR